ncbi:MAG: response regulator [Desulfovibrionaceae bacterium]
MSETTTILIADDDAISREVLSGLLEEGDYNLVYAVDGREALAKAQEIEPDMVLLDVLMPGMNGFDVCKRLREDTRLGEVPVVMITGLDDRKSRIKGIEAGADDFITKPFDGDELRVRVASIARLNRYRRLMAERARLDWVIKESDQGFVVIDKQDRILFANDMARSYLGLLGDVDAASGASFTEVVQRTYRQEPTDGWLPWPPPLGAPPRPLFLVRPETDAANACWISVALFSQMVESGRQILVRMSDVTNEIVSQHDMWTFHSMVSHKLRTPLSGILGSAELLSIQAADMAPDEIAGLAGGALEEGRRLHREIEDILHYLEAPSLAKAGKVLAMGSLADIAEAIRVELGLESVTVAISQGLDRMHFGLSAQALENILFELFENAKRFHPRNAPELRLSVSVTANGQACLTVRDNGVHLPTEQLGKVWTPYFQGEKYHTGEMSGMGLGLSMVASMVWGVGGRCRIYNREDGPGLAVELILPVLE